MVADGDHTKMNPIMKFINQFKIHFASIVYFLLFGSGIALHAQKIKRVSQIDKRQQSQSLIETDPYVAGRLRIKMSSSKSLELEKANFSSGRYRTSDGYVKTGEPKLDEVLSKTKTSDMKRVFPYAGSYENKHKKYGLHQWYELTFDDKADLEETINELSTIEYVLDVSKRSKTALTGIFEREMKVSEEGPASMTSPPNDPIYLADAHWSYHNTGADTYMGSSATADADIDLPEAWEIQTGSSDVIVAIIDTGMDTEHEDLAANMWVNEGEIPNNGIDDDNNGFVDDIHGYDFVDLQGDVIPEWQYHGSHVGGTVAAVNNNGIGVSGVAGGSGTGDGVRMMSCAIFGEYINSEGEQADSFGYPELAFIYAADNGAVIAQNSWGIADDDPILKLAIDYFIAEAGYDQNSDPYGPMQGGLVIFSAGNSAVDRFQYPGAYSEVIAVTATDYNNEAAWFTNYGDWVDIAAPGMEIVSIGVGDNYYFLDGTSMASPHVSGVAALIVSEYAGNITPEEVRGRLEYTATPYVSDLYLGKGILNAYDALQPNVSYPKLTLDKKELNVSLLAGEESTQNLTLTNDGVVDITYELSSRGGITFNLPDDGLVAAESFEDYNASEDIGDDPIYFSTEDDLWVISDSDPYSGDKHLVCESDMNASGAELRALIANQTYTADHTFFNAKIKISARGASWYLSLTQYTEENGDFFSMFFDDLGSIYISDNNDSFSDDNYPGFVPAGNVPIDEYFDLTVAANANLNRLVVYINHNQVAIVESTLFPVIEGFAVTGLMEIDGVEFSIDDYSLHYGAHETYQWITSEPASGTLAPGEQYTFDLTVKAYGDFIENNEYTGGIIEIVSSAAGFEDYEVPVSLDVTYHNFATDGIATQSSTSGNAGAHRAIDGNTSGVWREWSVTHTQEEDSPWWQIELPTEEAIGKIVIYNRTDNCCSDRLSDFTVSVQDEDGASTFITTIDGLSDDYITIDAEGSIGSIIKIQINGNGILSLAEVEVYEFIPEEIYYFTPDPTKKYYIDIPAHGLRLASDGASNDPFVTDQATFGEDVEWQFVENNGYWSIQRAAGGSRSILRTDNTPYADMQNTNNMDGRTRYEFEQAFFDNSFYITLPTTSSIYNRLHITDDGFENYEIRMANSSSTGEWLSFKFREIEEGFIYQAEDYGDSFGTRFEASDDTEGNQYSGDLHITDVNDGDWLNYDLEAYVNRVNIDYQDITHISLRVATFQDTQLEIRDNDTDGDIIATIDLPSTGGSWETITTEIEVLNGYFPDDRYMYFMFSGNATGFLLDFNWWYFHSSKEITFFSNEVEETEAIVLNDENIEDFIIYPNPASDLIKIKTSRTILEEIKIYDISGDLILSTDKSEIDVSEFAKGVYFIVTEDNKKRFIKN